MTREWLAGFVRSNTEHEKDDEAEHSTKTVVEACVTGILCFPRTMHNWYTSSGRIDGATSPCWKAGPELATIPSAVWPRAACATLFRPSAQLNGHE